MPKPARAIAHQVREGKGWPVVMRASKAVMRGPKAKVIRTLATAVRVKATMNAVNMMLQQNPESQK